MKRLFLMRHAKSSWKDPSLSDIDRPLNKRGRHDAPLMAALFEEKGVAPDIIVTSEAKRAYDTARIVAEKLKSPVTIDKRLYGADVMTLYEVAEEMFRVYDNVMLVGHNPTMSLACSIFCNHPLEEDMPTAALVGIAFETDRDFKKRSGKRFIYLTPKKDLDAYS